MTTQTEALKLADAYANARAGWYVESLYGTSKGYTTEKQREMQEAHAALVKALAQPEQEPVETLAYKADYWKRMHDEVRVELIKALNAQPEQEPVAWTDENVIAWCLSRGIKAAEETTPPQRTWEKPWVSLTDKEKSDLWEISRAALPRYATYANLIEAKLKEKNT